MLYAIDNEGKLVEPSVGGLGLCPGCRTKLIPKAMTSLLIVPHWAHPAQDCDPWCEPETPWHKTWKEKLAPPHLREVVIGNHRADLIMNGAVVELQHSPISPQEIEEREQFYTEKVGRMVWFLDGRDWEIGHRIRDATAKRVQPLRNMDLKIGQTVKFIWRYAKKSFYFARSTINVDLGPYTMQILKLYWESDYHDHIRSCPYGVGRIFQPTLWQAALPAHLVNQ